MPSSASASSQQTTVCLASMNDQRIQSLVKLPIKRRDLVLINAIRQTYSEMDRQQTRSVLHRPLNKTPDISRL
ncbi:hypothetical protein K3Q26_004252 [Escherichia coli]|nr:hypothetical protein [Escherichia coli]